MAIFALQKTKVMALPELFIRQMEGLLGADELKTLLDGIKQEPLTSIRLNPRKWNPANMPLRRVGWWEGGFYLDDRPSFTFDPLLHAGCYYVQEAASMFLARLIQQYVEWPVAMLDLCAAPGGKTTTAIGALPEGSIVMCNEPIRQRAQILSENITKWGCPEVVVTNNYPADYARSGLAFDVILCDVPCSGEGMFRKDEEAVAQWTPRLVENCRNLQREIVAEAWKCLKPGGMLIYSTCTMNTQEDEENVEWICRELGGETLPVDLREEWQVKGSLLKGFEGHVYRFLPGFTESEGLFMAAVRKGDDQPQPKEAKRKSKGKEGRGRQTALTNEVAGWLQPQVEWVMRQYGDVCYALPAALMPFSDLAYEQLRMLSAGTALGQLKGRDFIPNHAVALSCYLQLEAFPQVELDYPEAIAYLRREAVSMPEGTPRGYVIVCWQHHPLGFVKNLGTRANNLYPQEWRVKSARTDAVVPFSSLLPQ